MPLRPAAIASIAAGGAALGVGASLLFAARTPATPEIGGYVLATPRTLPAVELVDERGAPFQTADFAGHWSLVYFGYTYCPDVCPLTLVKLAALKDQLAAEVVAPYAEYYFVSVDPKRDTPARLREYVGYFDPQFHGLTGSAGALAALARAMETVFEVPEGEGGDHYLVSHSSNIVVLDPNGDAHAVFAPPHEPAALAGDFAEVVARYEKLE